VIDESGISQAAALNTMIASETQALTQLALSGTT